MLNCKIPDIGIIEAECKTDTTELAAGGALLWKVGNDGDENSDVVAIIDEETNISKLEEYKYSFLFS